MKGMKLQIILLNKERVMNKFMKTMTPATMAAVLLLTGCQSGMYQIDTGKNPGIKKDNLSYKIVDRLDPEAYSEDCMPIEVKVTKTDGAENSEGLCCLTLGIIPAFYDRYENIDITVKTPIGTKSGRGSIHAKKWLGWICLIPYPGSGEERANDPKLPNSALEEKAKDQLIASIVSQFSKSEYVAYVRKLKDDRAQEELRVQKKKADLELLIKEGNYEKVMKACEEEKARTGKASPWSEIMEQAFSDLRKSIPSISDSKRLVSLFAIVNDVETKDAIVLRLGQLGKKSEIGNEALVRYVAATSSEEGRLIAVDAISDENELAKVAMAKYSEAVTVAAFKKLSADRFRNDVFAGEKIDENLAIWYIEAYGTEKEFVSIIKMAGEKLSVDILNKIRSRTKSDDVRDELNKIEVRARVAKIDSGKIEYHLFGWEIRNEIQSISDPKARSAFAECLLDRHCVEHNGVYVGFHDSFNPTYHGVDAIRKFTSFLSAKYCEGFDVDRCKGEKEGRVAFVSGLFNGMGQAEKDRRIKDVARRLMAKERIHFEGFYIGMTWSDFCVVSAQTGVIPYDYEVFDNKVERMKFNRSARFTLFDKEDGEFWSAYLRKYVPSKQKSLKETLGDALDGGSFSYQEGWDNKLDEKCYIFKSMKYGTRVVFGLQSGSFVLEEYK